VDASLALRWVLRDEKDARADALLHQWAISLLSCWLRPYFCALYLSVRRQRLTLEEAKLALEAIMHIGVEVTEPVELYPRSLGLAAGSGLTNAYDAQYVALAEIEGCELWTADERLAGAMKPSPSWLRVV